jgi:hypothetical protein
VLKTLCAAIEGGLKRLKKNGKKKG